MQGSLYLIPTFLSDDAPVSNISEQVREITISLRHFIVEEERTARRFLRKIDNAFPIDESEIKVFNEHTSRENIELYLSAIKENNIGLMSEAGLPCVADPGNEIVAAAHRMGIKVVPLAGPGSIYMALMASGLNGQKFAFWGYIPVKKEERIPELKKLIQQSIAEKQTQIVMDTPYRNEQLFDDLINVLPNNAKLCIAVDISSANESVRTLNASEWKKQKPVLNKKPALFLFSC